jgi:putative hemolysin
MIGSLETLLCLPKLNGMYGTISHQATPQAFIESVLKLFNIRIQVSSDEIARIPTTGPLVVVANNPFGALEGLLLPCVLLRVRPDIKVMANSPLKRLPELRDLFIFVKSFDAADAAGSPTSTACDGFTTARGYLEAGHMLGIFPAGNVSQIDIRSGKVTDPPWSERIGWLIRETGASVVTVYFHGSNGPVFQLAGMVHPNLRSALLPRELLNKRDRTIEVRIGSVIAPRSLQSFESNRELIDYLRQRTYALSSRATTPTTSHRFPALLPLPLLPGSKPSTFAPVLEPVASAVLQAEVDALPDSHLLVENQDLLVYSAASHQIPNLLTEIGRLREIAFRDVGEGTGKALDIDTFDSYYLHLFIWNRATQEIVGAYRLGCSDTILQRYGLPGLYTSTLFNYRIQFIEKISPALELGRSFVRLEYQRSYAPLMLLWRGIGQFVVRHPQYKMLFGPVSVSGSYTTMSRDLIIRFLRKQHAASDLSRLVKARNPPMRRRSRQWNPERLSRMTRDINNLSEIIQDLEADRKGVSILLKQYLKLGANVLAFNVDRNFCNALDVLILVDLTRVDRKVLQQYIGKSQIDQFLAYHQPPDHTP